jgi:subtilisin family serine protease
MPTAIRRVPVARCRWAVGAALALLVALAAAVAAAPAHAERIPPDHGTIVGVREGADADGLARTLRRAGMVSHPLPRIDALLVPRAGAAAVRRVLDDDRRVRWIEATVTRTLMAEPSAAVDPSTGRPYDWAFDAVGAGQAIAAAGGGSPVAVAVVDSGVDAGHPDLTGRIGPARDIAFGQSTAPDLVGHGTFVAGLIAAVDGNGIGTRGVAGATTVVPVRVTTSGSITSANAAAGIVAAVDAGVRVVNLSFGGPTISTAEKTALDYAASKDVLIVAASGNTRLTGVPVIYPAAAVGGTRGGWSSGISVGAVDPLGAPAPFSTANDAVTLSAPGAGTAADCGDGVYSTVPSGTPSLWAGSCLRTSGSSASPSGRYGYAEGTSFAAPIVAGGAALVRGANPRLTAPQAADVLRRTARQTVGTGWNARTGVGVVDLAAAVSLARRYDVTAPVPSIAAAPSGAGVSVSVTLKDASLGAELSPIASVRLEGSSDGATYTALAPDATGPLKVADAAAAGTRRWYRATACDANRNCATSGAGPVVAGASSSSKSGGGTSTQASLRPALASVAAGRPKACGACVMVAFTARGRGPLSWRAQVSGAGTTAVSRAGRLASARRHGVSVRLRRAPVCGGRLSVTVRLSSSLGQAKVTRTVRVSGRCVRARARSRR